MHAAKRVLMDLSATDKLTVTVFNKIDLLPDRAIAERLLTQIPDSVCVSAKAGENIGELLIRFSRITSLRRQTVEIRIPQAKGATVAMVHEKGHVLERKYENGAIVLTAELDRPLAAKLKKFVQEYVLCPEPIPGTY